jgi:hypothetical protein
MDSLDERNTNEESSRAMASASVQITEPAADPLVRIELDGQIA